MCWQSLPVYLYYMRCFWIIIPFEFWVKKKTSGFFSVLHIYFCFFIGFFRREDNGNFILHVSWNTSQNRKIGHFYISIWLRVTLIYFWKVSMCPLLSKRINVIQTIYSVLFIITAEVVNVYLLALTIAKEF